MTMLRDVWGGVKIEMVDAPIIRTATLTGATIDLKGYEGVNVIAAFGASGDTLSGSLYWTGKLQESADDSSWSDVAAGDVIGATTNVFALVDAPGDIDAVYSLGYRGTKRYVRAVITEVGVHTNGTDFGLLAAKFPHVKPAGNTVTP